MKSLALAAVLAATAVFAQVSPAAQTQPLVGGATDHDVAIWVHPTDVTLSRILSTNDQGSLSTYSLDGVQQSLVAVGLTRSVDVRYRVPFNGGRADVVLSVDISGNYSLLAAEPTPDGGLFLESIEEVQTSAGFTPTSASLYFNPRTQTLSVFVGGGGGQLKQWDVSDNGSGKLHSTQVRSVNFSKSIDGIAADDRTGQVFFTLAAAGVYRMPADADAGGAVLEVDSVDAGHLPGAAGLAFHFGAGSAGNLVVSSNTTPKFSVYSLGSGYPFVGSFTIVGDAGTPAGVQRSPAIEIVPLALGAEYSGGLVVASDPTNVNSKLVRWADLAGLFALSVDPTLDPRTSYGLGSGAPDAGSADGGAGDGGTDAGTRCPIVTGDAGSSDAGLTDGGTADAGSGCTTPGQTPGGKVPPAGGGFPEEPKTGCECGEAGMLAPFAALVWMLRPIRRRRAQ